MTITLDPVQLVIGVAAFLVAMALLARKMHQLDRVLHAAAAVVTRELKGAGLPDAANVVRRELNANSGSSIKDDVTALSVGMGYLGRGFDDLSHAFDEHVKDHHQHQEPA